MSYCWCAARLRHRLPAALARSDPGAGPHRRRRWRAARRRRRLGEVSRRPLQPAADHDVLAAGQPTTVSDLLPLIGPVVVGTIVLIALRWRLNVMSLPEDEARALGLATGPFRIAIVAAASLVTSASVATSGVIGWVGLVVPHLARALVGPDFPRLIPAAALLGGGYLLFIDTSAATGRAAYLPGDQGQSSLVFPLGPKILSFLRAEKPVLAER